MKSKRYGCPEGSTAPPLQKRNDRTAGIAYGLRSCPCIIRSYEPVLYLIRVTACAEVIKAVALRISWLNQVGRSGEFLLK